MAIVQFQLNGPRATQWDVPRSIEMRQHNPNFDRFGLAMLSLFVFAIPWEEMNLSFIPGVASSRIIGIVAFATGLLVIGARFSVRPLSPAHYPMLVFVGWACLSYMWTLSTDLTSTRLISYIQLMTMVWLCWELAPHPHHQARLLSAYVLGTFVSSLGIIANFLTGHQSLSVSTGGLDPTFEVADGRYSAFGFNENELSVFLALSIPMSWYLILTRRNHCWHLIFFAQLASCLMAILLTGSRGGLLATIPAIAIFPLSFFRFSRLQKFSCCIIGVSIVAGALSLIPKPTRDRLLSTSSEIREGTLTKRTIIWRAGAQVFREHPFFGVGAGAYPEAVAPILEIRSVAHNTFLSILVEGGVIGAGIFVVWGATLLGCVYVLGPLERRLWVTLLLTWGVGVFSMTWEHRKPTWLLFAILTAAAGNFRSTRRVFPYRTFESFLAVTSLTREI